MSPTTEHTPPATREDDSVTAEATPQDAPSPQDEGTTTQQVSSKERSAVYTAAVARLRDKYREEFDGYLMEGYAKIGVEWTPKPNEVQKAKLRSSACSKLTRNSVSCSPSEPTRRTSRSTLRTRKTRAGGDKGVTPGTSHHH